MARLNAILIGIILVGALAKVLLVLDYETVREGQAMFLPLDAVDYLAQAHPAGPMFNSYNWGGYLMFALPDYPVFVDGRTDLYGDALLMTYLETARGADGWRQTLERYGINLVVVEAGSGLAHALRDETGWRLDYEDKLAVVWSRTEAH